LGTCCMKISKKKNKNSIRSELPKITMLPKKRQLGPLGVKMVSCKKITTSNRREDLGHQSTMSKFGAKWHNK